MYRIDERTGKCQNSCLFFGFLAKRRGWKCGTCGDSTPIIIEPEKFNTRLDLPNTASKEIKQAFVDAVARWESVISGDIPEYNAKKGQGKSKCINLPRIVDDTFICVELKEIDGAYRLRCIQMDAWKMQCRFIVESLVY